MKKETFDEILFKLNDGSLKSDADKIKYLESVIEETDYDCNGFNDELIDLLNKLKK